MDSLTHNFRRVWYAQLQGTTSIRLLALHGGAEDVSSETGECLEGSRHPVFINSNPQANTPLQDKICCQLMPSTINVVPPYECLSYVWGKSLEMKEISCNGSAFPVTPNLYSALRRLRYPDRDRLLWIDQICIDQENIPERNQQVGMMRNIYRGAEKVIIWLGDKENDSDMAIDFIPILVMVMELLGPGQSLSAHNATSFGLPNCPSRPWLALGHLLRRPWFQRVWTVQECVLAREAVIYCGEKEMPWKMIEALLISRSMETQPIFQTCVSYMSINGDPPVRTALRQVLGVFQERLMLSQSIRATDMADILRTYRDCLSTDPRDKLFAFLGCVSDSTRLLYSPPDYRRSIRDVYTEVAVVSLTKFGHLKVLTHAGIGSQDHKHTLPSWVADWSVQTRAFTLDYHNSLSISNQKGMKAPEIKPLYSASGDSQPSFRLSAEHDILNVSGNFLGKIAAIGDHLGFETLKPPEAVESLQESATRHLKVRQAKIRQCFEMAAHCTPYPSGGSHLSAVRMTLVGGMTPSRARTSADEVDQNFETYEEGISSLLDPRQRVEEGDSDEKSRRRYAIGFAFEELAIDRAFAVTEDKYVGLVPVGTKVGDCVCIILGCVTPFIVREENGQYLLVGESYIHGIMDGEAMTASQYSLQDIALK
jgi:hypothetical protein